ncbi:MAG: hypothetical protein C0514_07150 [Candidatus Puniceispirillum sp.]|nr:hypothetical protein [Candidatus Puniceispirillum sp.]
MTLKALGSFAFYTFLMGQASASSDAFPRAETLGGVPYTEPGRVITTGRPVIFGHHPSSQEHQLNPRDLLPEKFFPSAVWATDGNQRVILRKAHGYLSPKPVQDAAPLTLTNLNARFKQSTQRPRYMGKELTLQENTLYLGDTAIQQSHPALDTRFDYFIDENLQAFAGPATGHDALKGMEYGVAAGEFWLDENGKICFMTTRTGHYGCSDAQMQLAIRFFKDRGFMADDALCAPCEATPLASPNEWLSSRSDLLAEDDAAPIIPSGGHPLIGDVARLNTLPIHFPEVQRGARSLGRRLVELKERFMHARTTPIDRSNLDKTDAKILSVLEHNDLEIRMRCGMTTPEDFVHCVHPSLVGVPNHKEFAQQELEKLKANRPHTELYQRIFGALS